MWYSFELITAVRERSERQRIYAEVHLYLVFCRDQKRLDSTIQSEADEYRSDKNAIKIFDNVDIDNPDVELHMVDGVRLPVVIRLVNSMPSLARLEQVADIAPSEISHLMFIFDTEEEYNNFCSSDGTSLASSAKVFEDPARYILTVVD